MTTRNAYPFSVLLLGIALTLTLAAESHAAARKVERSTEDAEGTLAES